VLSCCGEFLRRALLKDSVVETIKRMADKLSEEDFKKQLHTEFRVRAGGQADVALELAEVEGYQGSGQEPGGMERFSLLFDGPPDFLLEQGVYAFDHEELGEVTLFLVPVERTERGFRYESVFNFFRE
jgi:hypothetical protein